MLGFSSQTAPPLIIQLQESAMDPAAKVSTLLTKAKVAASKLRLEQVLDWVRLEANGYGDEAVPDYRLIAGDPKLLNPYNGLIPIFFDDPKLMSLFKETKTSQSISELESLSMDPTSYLRMHFPAPLQTFILRNMDLPIPMQGMWLIGANQIQGIINFVRQRILDWALELENAGVLGEGLTFSATERAAAMSVTNHIHGSNIGVLGTISDQAQVSNSQQITGPSGSDLLAFIEQVRSSQSLLPINVQREVARSLSVLDEQAASAPCDQSKIIGALKSIRTVCEGAGGNLVATGIVTLVAQMLGG